MMNMRTECRLVLLSTVFAAFMIACGYTELRTESRPQTNPKRPLHVQKEMDIEFSDRMITLAGLTKYGTDSLSHAQSDSIGGVIVHLTRKKEKWGWDSLTGGERKFLSLIATKGRTDSLFSGEQK
jgi:hypothetical protein